MHYDPLTISGFENFLRVAKILGLLDFVTNATDPLLTPMGKLRANDDTPKRARGQHAKHHKGEYSHR